MGMLTAPTAPQSPSPDQARENLRARIRYLRSYLLMRVVIGVVGILLPVALLGGDAILSHGWHPRSSLSSYYYSGMRDIFVSALCVTAFFLIFYKIFEVNLENTLSIAAGGFALGVALFPTGRPKDKIDVIGLSPLQDLLTERAVQVVHFTCAGLFIAALAWISWLFGNREGARSQRRDGHTARFSPTFWRWFHRVCAIVIAAAVAFMVLSMVLRWPDRYTLTIGESVSVLAFGVSWLTKGNEYDVLWSAEAAAEEVRTGTSEDTGSLQYT